MRDCDMFRGFVIGEGDVPASIPPHGMVKGRWVYGSYLCTKGADEVEVHCIWGLDHGPEGKVIEPLTLGRCTGVFDSEDEIVYEGDIIKCEAEKSIMCVEWVDSGAYFKVEYLYKDGVWTGADTQPVPFRSFLQTGQRFKVIGSLVTPTKQVQVHFPDYKKNHITQVPSPNPVPVPVKSVMKVQPSGYRIEVPLKDFITSCKLLMRKARAKNKNKVILSAKDSQFSMEWGNVGSILPATGTWPQFASIEGNTFRGIAEVPPRKDPVVLEIKGDRLWVDGFNCDCRVSGSSQKLSSPK